MELLGFQLGHTAHHPFICWNTEDKSRRGTSKKPAPNHLSPFDFPEDPFERDIVITALSL